MNPYGSRKIARRSILAVSLLLSGCIRPEYPPPLAPLPQSAETYARVLHLAAYRPARLQADPTPIWPGPPTPVPTTLEILAQQPGPHPQPVSMRHRGGYGLCHPTSAQPKPPGIALGLCYTASSK